VVSADLLLCRRAEQEGPRSRPPLSLRTITALSSRAARLLRSPTDPEGRHGVGGKCS